MSNPLHEREMADIKITNDSAAIHNSSIKDTKDGEILGRRNDHNDNSIDS